MSCHKEGSFSLVGKSRWRESYEVRGEKRWETHEGMAKRWLWKRREMGRIESPRAGCARYVLTSKERWQTAN